MEKNYYLNKEQFEAMTTAWKKEKCHSATNHVIYNLLRGKPADNGFVAKAAKILPDGDPLKWKAFNEALANAKRLTRTPTAAWDKYDPNAYFKANYGIDMPSDFTSKLFGIEK